MEHVLSEIITALMYLGLITALFFGFKYWIDKGGANKALTKLNDRLCEKNSKLRKELEAYKRLSKEFEFLLKKKLEEVEELQIALEAYKEEENEKQND